MTHSQDWHCAGSYFLSLLPSLLAIRIFLIWGRDQERERKLQAVPTYRTHRSSPASEDGRKYSNTRSGWSLVCPVGLVGGGGLSPVRIINQLVKKGWAWPRFCWDFYLNRSRARWAGPNIGQPSIIHTTRNLNTQHQHQLGGQGHRFNWNIYQENREFIIKLYFGDFARWQSSNYEEQCSCSSQNVWHEYLSGSLCLIIFQSEFRINN